jgi:hypothetical protein
MKKLIGFILLFFISNIVFSQIIINQTVVEQPPYSVGDTITLNYSVQNLTGSNGFQYLWFRYHYSNKHIELIPSSTQFLQGQTQNFFHQWIGFNFIPNSTIGVGELDRQYYESGWNYVGDPNWNVVQLAIQKVGSPLSGNIISQKFIIKDNTDYTSIHRLHMAFAEDNNSQPIRPVGSQVLWLSLNDVKGLKSSVKIRVVHPNGYPISSHIVSVNDVNGGVIESKQLDSSGEATFTSLITDAKYYANILPVSNQNFMDNIVTVSDAYKAFLQITDKSLLGTGNYFKHPIEYIVGTVKNNSSIPFNSMDSYYLFAHISGIDVTSNANIPTKQNQSPLFYSTKLGGYNSGQFVNEINITESSHIFDFAYAWGGDVDFSHSTPPTENVGDSNRINRVYEEANVQMISKLESGKVTIENRITNTNLAGLQIVIKYDTEKLKLDNIIFDSGNEVTNFVTDDDGRISFGSIDQIGKGKIKAGTPYKLIFSPKLNVSNTMGLFYTILSDAVDVSGNKIKLNVQ